MNMCSQNVEYIVTRKNGESPVKYFGTASPMVRPIFYLRGNHSTMVLQNGTKRYYGEAIQKILSTSEHYYRF